MTHRISTENAESFPIFHRLPWNQHTLHGWIFESVFSIFVGFAYLVINNALLSFFIGIGIYHRAYHDHLHALIKKLDKYPTRLHSKVKLLLIEVIRFHNSAKEIFQQSAKVYSIFVLMILFSSIIFLACSILQVDLVSSYSYIDSKTCGPNIYVSLIFFY